MPPVSLATSSSSSSSSSTLSVRPSICLSCGWFLFVTSQIPSLEAPRVLLVYYYYYYLGAATSR
ncbi:hypothetical protein E2C01_030345 [Portunus trituberculatus]|uniref:Uncharacterized protein n=1 Tax=Portunus trituberculatus TaxID=210409 RepID=A0A5B7EUI2_PORTR|nr:hypothetical protein [Portunus trituberculatus]